MSKITEMELLNRIRLALQDMNCKTFRINVGCGYTPDGRHFSTGVPVGFSDLLVLRPDGKACFVETKLHPRKPTKPQCNFMLAMIKQNCPAGVCYTIEDAVNVVLWNENFANAMEKQLRSYYEQE